MKHEQAFNIYVVEDNEWYNKLLVHTLSLNPEFTVKSFFSGEEMLRELSDIVDVVTLDYRLPDTTGDVLLKKIKERSPNTEVIIISEQSEITTAVELLKLGAYDYLVKSEDIRDRLWNSVNHVRKHAGLKQKIEILQSEVEKNTIFKIQFLDKAVP